MKSLILTLSLLVSLGCQTITVQNELQSLEGDWVFESFFLGDAVLNGCGTPRQEPQKMTIRIEINGRKITFDGSAPVNQFSGFFDQVKVEDGSGIFEKEKTELITTEIAGPVELMQCENLFYDIINNATKIEVTAQDQLYVGYPPQVANSRGGGTFLIFNRQK